MRQSIRSSTVVTDKETNLVAS